MKLNINKAIEKIQDETVSYKETHPYYGLKDERGWLTRYPREDLVISLEDMSVFLNAGGRLDSCSTWGVNPYEGFQGLSPEKAAEFMLAAHCQRWDNVPFPSVLFEVHESCTFSDYLNLCKGARMKEELIRYNIEAEASLFTLANKDRAWFDRKIAAAFDFDNPFHMDWFRLQNLSHIKVGNKQFLKMAADHEKYEWRKRRNPVIYPSVIIGRTKKLIAAFVHKNHLFDCYLQLKTVGCTLIKAPVRHRVSIGRVVITPKKAFLTHKKSFKMVGGLDGRVHGVETINAIDAEEIIPVSIKQFGMTVFSFCNLEGKYFVWETERGFESHIEADTLRAAHTICMEKRNKREEMKNVLEKGIVSFRTFRAMTRSCLEGTLTWLWENSYNHLHNLLSGFNSWEEVFTDEIADIKFQMTPEFMESIKFRF